MSEEKIIAEALNRLKNEDAIEKQHADYKALAEAGLKNPMVFYKDILHFEDMTEDLHGKIIKELHKAEKNNKHFKCLIPRDHFKSTLLSEAEPLRELLLNPKLHFAIVSATTPISRGMVKEIKHLAAGETFKKCYPWFELASGSDKDSLAFKAHGKIHATREGNIDCYGADSNFVGTHYERIILDDLVNKDEKTGELNIEKAINIFKQLVPLLKPSQKFRVVGTRYANDDLYGYIDDSKRAKYFKSFIRKVEYDGKFILPNRYNWDVLNEKRDFIGDDRFFYAQYYNMIVPGEDAEFNPAWFNYEDMGKLFTSGFFEYMPKWIFVDPAWTTKSTSDNTAIVVIARDMTDQRYVIEARETKITPNKLINEIIKLYQRYPGARVYIENAAYGEIIKGTLKERAEQRGLSIPLFPAKHNNTKKEIRIRGLIGPVSRGKYIFDERQTALLTKMKAFPYLVKWDVLDCLAYSVKYIPSPDQSIAEEDLPQQKKKAWTYGWLLDLDKKDADMDNELYESEDKYSIRN